MSDKTVLEKATMPQWVIDAENEIRSIPQLRLPVVQTCSDLILKHAVPAYEESAATIRSLTELAQETVDHLEQVEDCQRCRGLTERWKAALALARRSK